MSSHNEQAIIRQVAEVPSTKMSLYEIVVQLIDSLQQSHAEASLSNEGVSELLRAIEGLISEEPFYQAINEHQARRFFGEQLAPIFLTIRKVIETYEEREPELGKLQTEIALLKEQLVQVGTYVPTFSALDAGVIKHRGEVLKETLQQEHKDTPLSPQEIEMWTSLGRLQMGHLAGFKIPQGRDPKVYMRFLQHLGTLNWGEVTLYYLRPTVVEEQVIDGDRVLKVPKVKTTPHQKRELLPSAFDRYMKPNPDYSVIQQVHTTWQEVLEDIYRNPLSLQDKSIPKINLTKDEILALYTDLKVLLSIAQKSEGHRTLILDTLRFLCEPTFIDCSLDLHLSQEELEVYTALQMAGIIAPQVYVGAIEGYGTVYCGEITCTEQNHTRARLILPYFKGLIFPVSRGDVEVRPFSKK